MKSKFLLTVGLITVLVPAPTRAADAPGADDHLRATLRDTMLQLRNAQNDLANLQATQASLADEKKDLGEKYEALKKQVAAEHAATDKTIAGLTTQLTDYKAAGASLKEQLEKAKAEVLKTAEALHAAEAQCAKLTAENQALERRAVDREEKNLQLFVLGNEILSRYEEFSLGNALRAKEPFVGSARAKLENLVQDYQDKLLDQRVQK